MTPDPEDWTDLTEPTPIEECGAVIGWETDSCSPPTCPV